MLIYIHPIEDESTALIGANGRYWDPNILEKKKHLQHRVKLTDTKGISVICQSIYDCARRIGANEWTISRNLREKGFYKTNAWLVEPYIPTHSNQL